MTLVRENLKRDIKNLTKEMMDEKDSDEALEKYSEKLSLIIHNYILSATVIVNAGQTVQVVVPAGTGATTSPGSGKLK